MQKTTVHTNQPGSLLQPQLVLPHAGHLLKVLRVSAVATGAVLTGIVALQLVYPANRSLPRASFGGIGLNYVSEEEIIKRLEGIDNKTFTATTGTHSYRQTLGDIGISIETQKIAHNLSNYPLAQRLVPFSVLFYQPPVIDNHLIVSDAAKLKSFAAKIAAENNSLPIEGSITNKDGEIVITHSKDGRDYRAEDIANYFSAYTHESLADEALLPYSSVAAVNSYQHLEAVAEQAEKLMQTKQTVTHEVSSIEIDSAALERAIRFVAQTDKKVAVDINAEVLAAGLEDAADAVFIAPSVSSAGHELDWLPTAQAVAAALKNGQASSTVVLKPLKPTGSKLYPATSKGIQQLIADWKSANASLEPAIAFAEIGGYSRRAGFDADVRYFSASVYKVFPAWYALDQIDQGRLDPSGPIAGGFNLSDCFHNMIIISDSKCSEAIVNKYGGWSVLDAFIKEHGIGGIALSEGVTITADGMTSFLHKLDGGELLSPERTTYLLDAMKRQKYRTGIPAGSDGEVADKVGYQPKTYSWHDAGIVYHPKGKYTLVILTHKGASLPKLATLARQISDTLSR